MIAADDGAFDKFLWVAACLVALFTVTVPDCAKTKAEKYYIVTFIMSIAWMGDYTCNGTGCNMNRLHMRH